MAIPSYLVLVSGVSLQRLTLLGSLQGADITSLDKPQSLAHVSLFSPTWGVPTWEALPLTAPKLSSSKFPFCFVMPYLSGCPSREA